MENPSHDSVLARKLDEYEAQVERLERIISDQSARIRALEKLRDLSEQLAVDDAFGAPQITWPKG